MSQLKVGDIQIDGTRVTIGASAAATRDSPPAASGAPLGTLARWTLTVPGSAGLYFAAGLALAVAGTMINVLLHAWTDPVGALAHGGALAPAGVGLLALGAAKRALRMHPRLLHRSALGSEAGAYLSTIRELLRKEDPNHTVGWIVSTTGWTEARVVHALALLRGQEQVEEKLDLISGQFYYCSGAPSIDPRSLDARIDTLTD
jgi:hypothetical protein